MIADIPTGAWIVLLAAAVGWYSTLDYAIDTWRGRLRPSLTSWGVWTVTAAIGTAAAWSAGSTVGVVISAATCLRCAQVLIPAAFVEFRERGRARRGWPPLVVAQPHSRGQRILDVGCLAACGVIGVVWQIADDPVLALVLSIVVDAVACIPTIWHGCHGQEHPKPYLLGMVGPVIALLVVRERVLADYAWPLYELGVNILMVIPPLVVGWPGGRIRRPWLHLTAPAATGLLYVAAVGLVFTGIPEPGGQWAQIWRTTDADRWGRIAIAVVVWLVAVAAIIGLWRYWHSRAPRPEDPAPSYEDPPTVPIPIVPPAVPYRSPHPGWAGVTAPEAYLNDGLAYPVPVNGDRLR